MLQLVLSLPPLIVSLVTGRATWRALFTKPEASIPAEWRWQISQPVVFAAAAILPGIQVEESPSWRLAQLLSVSYCLAFAVIVHSAFTHNDFYKVHARSVLAGKVSRFRSRYALAAFYLLAFLLSVAMVVAGRLRA